MIIVTGHIVVHQGKRDEFVALSTPAMAAARLHPACEIFVVAPDPLEEDQVVICELWTSKEELTAFRGQGPGSDLSDLIASANVREFSAPVP